MKTFLGFCLSSSLCVWEREEFKVLSHSPGYILNTFIFREDWPLQWKCLPKLLRSREIWQPRDVSHASKEELCWLLGREPAPLTVLKYTEREGKKELSQDLKCQGVFALCLSPWILLIWNHWPSLGNTLCRPSKDGERIRSMPNTSTFVLSWRGQQKHASCYVKGSWWMIPKLTSSWSVLFDRGQRIVFLQSDESGMRQGLQFGMWMCAWAWCHIKETFHVPWFL